MKGIFHFERHFVVGDKKIQGISILVDVGREIGNKVEVNVVF